MHTVEQLCSGALKGATRLDLSAGLTEFPREIFSLADTLEVLNLSGNALSALPDDLPRLARLKVIFCSGNPFTQLPPVLGRCPSLEMVGFKSCRIEHVPPEALPPRLRWLILTDNRITELPEQLGDCSRLQKLMLAGNQLRSLPASLARCEQIELLRLSSNRFEDLPPPVLALPRLSWLAWAGNPVTDRAEAAQVARAARRPGRKARTVRWPDLALQDLLGEGASGLIHRALWRPTDQAERDDSTDLGDPVIAVKLFKGQMTSDGLPRSEMAACLVAGRHKGLIPVLGAIEGHPEGLPGLAMPLLDARWRTLAAPPSLDSCTRDVYDPALRLAPAQAMRLVTDIAQATAHLHASGLLHGDLYAHNIQWDPASGEALLGDFGAASFLPSDSPALAHALQAMDLRALGILLEEVAERTHEAAGPGAGQAGAGAWDPDREPTERARPQSINRSTESTSAFMRALAQACRAGNQAPPLSPFLPPSPFSTADLAQRLRDRLDEQART